MTLLREDRALLDAFRAGDDAALERVYTHYVDLVTDVVRRGVVYSGGKRVTGVPAHDVFDLVQETFVRAFRPRARRAYDGLRPYQPYLLTICRNLLADWSRKRGREIPADLDLERPLVPERQSTSADDDAPEPWADPAVMAIVERYVAGLEPPESDVYEQRFTRGLSQAKAAAALDIGRQRLRTVEKRIREGLSIALQELTDD